MVTKLIKMYKVKTRSGLGLQKYLSKYEHLVCQEKNHFHINDKIYNKINYFNKELEITLFLGSLCRWLTFSWMHKTT